MVTISQRKFSCGVGIRRFYYCINRSRYTKNRSTFRRSRGTTDGRMFQPRFQVVNNSIHGLYDPHVGYSFLQFNRRFSGIFLKYGIPRKTDNFCYKILHIYINVLGTRGMHIVTLFSDGRIPCHDTCLQCRHIFMVKSYPLLSRITESSEQRRPDSDDRSSWFCNRGYRCE